MKKRKRTKRNTAKSTKSSTKRNQAPLETVDDFFSLSKRAQEILIAVPNAISLVRSKNLSPTAAAKATGISPGVLKRRARTALQKLENGRYAALPFDDLFRVVIAVAEGRGPIEIATRDSREASKAGKHSAAVHRYLETGDDSALRRFEGQYIVDSEGKKIPLLTDREELDELGSAGVLSFESLYARSL